MSLNVPDKVIFKRINLRLHSDIQKRGNCNFISFDAFLAKFEVDLVKFN